MKALENIAHIAAIGIVLFVAYSLWEGRQTCVAGYQPDSPACQLLVNGAWPF